MLKRGDGVKSQITPWAIDEVAGIGWEEHILQKTIQLMNVQLRERVGFNSDGPLSKKTVNMRTWILVIL